MRGIPAGMGLIYIYLCVRQRGELKKRRKKRNKQNSRDDGERDDKIHGKRIRTSFFLRPEIKKTNRHTKKEQFNIKRIERAYGPHKTIHDN
jgi:hypothetical protein